MTLDADLVAAVEAEAGQNLSARVNAALRADLEDRNRQRALAGLLDRLAAERGPLDTAGDEAEIARFRHLLGGADAEPFPRLTG